MATALEVVRLFDDWNESIVALNDSDSFVISEVIAEDASTLSGHADWGNGTSYITQVNRAFMLLSDAIATPEVNARVQAVNSSIQAYHDYVTSSWWQFGSGQRPKTMTLPDVVILGEQ